MYCLRFMRGSYHYPHLCVGFLFIVLYPVIRFLLLLRASLCHFHTTFHTNLSHTRQELDHCSDPLGTESHDVQLDLRERERDIYIYIWAMVATSCDLNAPRCTTKAHQVRLHGSRGGVFVDHRHPRDPGDPVL